MKSTCDLMQKDVTYDVSDIPSRAFHRMRDAAIDGLAKEMLAHYEFPGPGQKQFRSDLLEVARGLGNQIWPADENVEEAVKKFKRLVRQKAVGGHFRGGKWRTASK